MKESILTKFTVSVTKYGNFISTGLWVVFTIWLFKYMDSHNIKIGYIGSFLYGIGMGRFIYCCKRYVYIYLVHHRSTIKPLIKRRDRKRVEKFISELRRGKYIASSKRDELVKSIENKLSENPTEEQQKLYIDRYLKVDEIFEKIENVYDSQIIEAKAGLHYFDL